METLTFTDTADSTAWEQAAAHVAQHAPDATRMYRLEAIMDADIHGIWLDEQAGTVWHAWADTDVHGHAPDTWILTSETAVEALDWLEEQTEQCADALADPENHYDVGHRTPEDDLAVIDELNTVQLAGFRRSAERHIDPSSGVSVALAVDAHIRQLIDRARREVGMLADLRAQHLSGVIGTERGGVARAARELGITEAGIRKVINAADGRRSQIIEAGHRASDPERT